jgi:glycerol-3-phosphate dehydrogenase (NAD(P)+)
MSRMAVLGAGSWGTALSIHLARAGRPVSLWARDAALVDEMIATSVNLRYLADVPLPRRVVPTSSLEAALDDAQFVIVAVPSHGLRAVVRAAAPLIPSQAVVVSATKGLETDSLRRMSQVIEEETAGRLPVVVLSGPSFAAEVARVLPAAVLAA